MSKKTVNIYMEFDPGRRFGKAEDPNNKFLVTSGYTRSQKPTDDDREIFIDGQYYRFDRDMKAEEDPLKSDRMFNAACYSAARLAKAKGAGDGTVVKVVIATLPTIDDYKNKARRAEWEGYFKGKTQSVVYDDDMMTIEFIKVYVYPQAVIMFLANQKKYQNKSKILFYYIGSMSRELAIFQRDENGRWRLVYSKSLDDGILYLFDMISDALSLDHIKYSYDDIDAVIRGLDDRSHPKAMLIRQIINAQLEDYVSDKILGDLTQRKIDPGISMVIGGGGGVIVADRVKAERNVIEVGDIWSNADAALKMMLAEEKAASECGKESA